MSIEEIEAFEEQFDMTTRAGMIEYHEALMVKQNEKDIEYHQVIMEREWSVSKEDWDNTTYAVKMAIIYMLRNHRTVAELEVELQEWLDNYPI